jgi:hypothetical protein
MCQNPATCLHSLADDRNQELILGRFLDATRSAMAEMLAVTGRFTGH